MHLFLTLRSIVYKGKLFRIITYSSLGGYASINFRSNNISVMGIFTRYTDVAKFESLYPVIAANLFSMVMSFIY